MPSKKNNSSALSHKLPIRNVVGVSCSATLGFALILIAEPSHMDAISRFGWCREWYHIIYLLQANILECTLQYKSTVVAVGFFPFVVLYEVLASTLGARLHIFAYHHISDHLLISVDTDSCVLYLYDSIYGVEII